MSYIDGFLLPVPKKQLDQYLLISKKAGEVWRDHGALGYVETVAEDVKTGKWTSFPQSVKLKKNELVIFSWILFKSRAHRDKVNKAVMKDERMTAMMNEPMPVDGKRMIYGGFEVRVDLDPAKKKAKPKAKAKAKKKSAKR